MTHWLTGSQGSRGGARGRGLDAFFFPIFFVLFFVVILLYCCFRMTVKNFKELTEAMKVLKGHLTFFSRNRTL